MCYMSDKKRILFVTQEMNPYTVLSEISDKVRNLAPFFQNKGFEIRVLMPKYGLINERRHRLHEVVRLSGMNIIVDDDDFPLIIKVASLPGSRLQVYFLDNEEFFKRKFVFSDAEEKPFEDNQDRMVFFCKGVIETVKKFGWPPDIIHCSGWFTSLVPLYLKKVYHNDPVFDASKIVYSVYPESYSAEFTERFFEIAAINDLTKDDLAAYKDGDKPTLNAGAMSHSDAIINDSSTLDTSDEKIWSKLELPKLDYIEDPDEHCNSSLEFFNQLLS